MRGGGERGAQSEGCVGLQGVGCLVAGLHFVRNVTEKQQVEKYPGFTLYVAA